MSDLPSAQSLLRMRDVVSLYAISSTTIRRATASGELPCLVLPSGHRRFKKSDLLRWMGQEEGVAGEKLTDGKIQIGAIVRVSSRGQNRATGNSKQSSLQHQKARLKKYIQGRWGKKANVVWYERVSSGMNFNCPVFLRMITHVTQGRFKGGYLVAENESRIARFSTNLIRFLATQNGAQVIYSMKEDEDDSTSSLASDILDVVTHFANRSSGEKSARIPRVVLTTEQLRFAYNELISGNSLRIIHEKFQELGWKEDSEGRSIGIGVIRKRLRDNMTSLEALYGDKEKTANSFLRFTRGYIKKSSSPRITISRKAILRSYGEYAKQNNCLRITDRKIDKLIKDLGWERGTTSKGDILFKGISLSFRKDAKN